MIKNKELHIKIILKAYLKILKQVKNISDFLTYFCSTKHLYLVTILKNSSKK